MATINFRIKGSKNPASIYLRFKDGRIIDIEIKTGLLINPANWDQKKQRVRNVIDVGNRSEINDKLYKLSFNILENYNTNYYNGVVMDKFWFENEIETFFKRPIKNEYGKIDEAKTYFTDFAQNWIDTTSKTYKISANKYIEDKSILNYQSCLNEFKEFQAKNKLKLADMNNLVLDNFSIYLSKKMYSELTVKKKISRIKFFCKRAESENLAINKQFKERVFVKEQEIEYKKPYLNESEIKAIFELKLEPNCYMDNVRDNLIIGLWTGLRVSDFLTRLNVSNIDDGFIKIKSKKTKMFVNIPIHKQVAFVLNKRNGALPKKIDDQKFNESIRMLARLVDIDEEIVGGVQKMCKETNTVRKIIGTYKKWELVTSHICRRSFCTNLIGKVSNKIIMDIGGWKSEDQMLHYNQQTNLESAIALQKYWVELNK